MTRRGAWLAGPGICSATPGGPHRHDRDPAPLFRAHVWCPSADGEDYVGSLDDRGDLAALGQAELADGPTVMEATRRTPLAWSSTLAMASPLLMLVTRAGIWFRALSCMIVTPKS